ncbi:MAG: glycosyltransferase, partial [Colwellia sp.]
MLLLFIVCIFFIFYVYVGYPFLLWLLTRNTKLTFPSNNYFGDISVVMVVCNEGNMAAKKIQNLLSLKYSGGSTHIYVVDDASDDNTVEIVSEYSNRITFISSETRQGKAHGLNLAMEQAKTELVMLVDCRQELEVNVVEYLASWFTDDPAMGAVSGELMFKEVDGSNFSSGVDGYWRYEKFIRKSEAILGSVPGVSGALYMLRRASYKDIPVDTLLDDVQIPMVCAAQGYRVGYDERAIAWDVPSMTVNQEKARKVRTLSGNYQLLLRFPKWVLPGGHPIWWQFLSHKISRLVAPFVIILS